MFGLRPSYENILMQEVPDYVNGGGGGTSTDKNIPPEIAAAPLPAI